jgi:jumonji domain-containing protein 7
LQEDDGSVSYVKPLERLEPFDKVIRYIAEQEENQLDPTPIKYAQTRMFFIYLLSDEPRY